MFREKETTKRLTEKTSEGEFIYELENSCELSSKLSEQILLTAKSCLLRGSALQEGQVEVITLDQSAKSGESISESRKRKVVLTLDDGKSDLELKAEFGKSELRRVKIQRITEEALEQEGVLSQEDFSSLFEIEPASKFRAIFVPIISFEKKLRTSPPIPYNCPKVTCGTCFMNHENTGSTLTRGFFVFVAPSAIVCHCVT